MRAIIAIAETPEDAFKTLCVQTMTEIREFLPPVNAICSHHIVFVVLIDIELMARSGGIRTLLHIVADGSPDLAPIITSAFLIILDSPRTRQYLSPGDEFEVGLPSLFQTLLSFV